MMIHRAIPTPARNPPGRVAWEKTARLKPKKIARVWVVLTKVTTVYVIQIPVHNQQVRVVSMLTVRLKPKKIVQGWVDRIKEMIVYVIQTHVKNQQERVALVELAWMV